MQGSYRYRAREGGDDDAEAARTAAVCKSAVNWSHALEWQAEAQTGQRDTVEAEAALRMAEVELYAAVLELRRHSVHGNA